MDTLQCLFNKVIHIELEIQRKRYTKSMFSQYITNHCHSVKDIVVQFKQFR